MVVDVSIGAQHCLALTSEGKVFGWGKNTCGEVNESEDIVSEPTLIEVVSGKNTVGISCGAFEVSHGFTSIITCTLYKHVFRN